MRQSVTRDEGKRDVGPGWAALLDPLFDFCEQHDVRVVQVKEKFGGLRFYVGGMPVSIFDAWQKLLDTQERAAEETCEWCGAPAAGSTTQGWRKVLCAEHLTKWAAGDRWS